MYKNFYVLDSSINLDEIPNTPAPEQMIDTDPDDTETILKRMGIKQKSPKAKVPTKFARSRKAPKRSIVEEEEMKILRNLGNIEKEEPSEPKDEYDRIGEYVASKMRSLSKRRTAEQMEDLEAQITAILNQRPHLHPVHSVNPIESASSSFTTPPGAPGGASFTNMLYNY